MKQNLAHSFQIAETINREQEKKLQNEIYKEQRIVNTMIQEIMWGSSPNNIKFDARKDFDITSKDADLFYEQALQHIENDTEWYKR